MQNDVLAKTNKQQRIQMASKGENIEALIAKNEPEVIAKLIDYQYAKEHYEEWKTHEHGAVRYALACLGIFPETFINDKNPKIREAVVRHHNEYCSQLLARNKKRHWEFVCAIINTKTDLKYVKEFLDARVPKGVNKDKLRAIRLYYAAKTTVPNMIEKTMSPAQLFQTNSPFWVVGLTITHIQNIQDLYPQVESDAFFKYFDQLLDKEQYWTTRGMLLHRHRKETE
jgi:hypothetical protein